MPKGVYPRRWNPFPNLPTAPALIDRFWSKVDKTEGCWLWTGSRFRSGYGQFQYDGRPHSAHRIAWLLTHGKLPGQRVLHHCDVRSCVRPDHLFLGTDADNMRDMAQKARHHRSRMAPEMVLEVRRRAAAGESQRSLAREFDRSEAWVSMVVRKIRWPD